MRKYEIFDISGDAGIRAWGGDLPVLFVNAAEGLFSLITDPAPSGATEKRRVSAQADSAESLLVAWLNELVFHFDAYGFLARRIRVRSFRCEGGGAEGRQDCSIVADAEGETFDPDRHVRKLLPKAATWHKLKLEHRNDSWFAEIIIDI
ncbi:MAG: archease [Thermodesulfovibrionales bacterium]